MKLSIFKKAHTNVITIIQLTYSKMKKEIATIDDIECTTMFSGYTDCRDAIIDSGKYNQPLLKQIKLPSHFSNVVHCKNELCRLLLFSEIEQQILENELASCIDEILFTIDDNVFILHYYCKGHKIGTSIPLKLSYRSQVPYWMWIEEWWNGQYSVFKSNNNKSDNQTSTYSIKKFKGIVELLPNIKTSQINRSTMQSTSFFSVIVPVQGPSDKYNDCRCNKEVLYKFLKESVLGATLECMEKSDFLAIMETSEYKNAIVNHLCNFAKYPSLNSNDFYEKDIQWVWCRDIVNLIVGQLYKIQFCPSSQKHLEYYDDLGFFGILMYVDKENNNAVFYNDFHGKRFFFSLNQGGMTYDSCNSYSKCMLLIHQGINVVTNIDTNTDAVTYIEGCKKRKIEYDNAEQNKNKK